MVNETTANPDVMDEFAALMDSVADKQRDPNIPAGTLLGEDQVAGMPTRWHKQDSMVRMGDTVLPERMPLYHYPDNETSLIPTPLLMKRLSKVDANGHRVWSREPFPDGIEVPYITKNVPMLDGSTMTRRFPSELAYEQFMRAKHGDQWESMLRAEQREEREQDRVEQRELTKAMLAAAQAATGQNQQAFVPGSSIIDNLNADGLKALAAEFNVELSDRRSPEAMREDLRTALEAN